MNILKNICIPGTEGKEICLDLFYNSDRKLKPVIIYAHGFNGFKDWGNFDLIASQFAKAGFLFIKFNFSHNGTSPQHPEEFVDLEAYANNNYTIELDDLDKVINWVWDSQELSNEIDRERLYLLGHSMGGGIVILKAAEDSRIKKITTWAAISECKTPWGNWTDEKIKEWKERGVAYITNSRTNQEMPLNFQLYENYYSNEERLNIEHAIRRLQVPVLICHGSKDDSVPFFKAELIKSWQPGAELFVVESNHVFERKHPWNSTELPKAMQDILTKTIEFYLSQKSYN